MNDTIIEFRQAMAAAGIELAAGQHVTPDGKLHRARAADDKAGALSIWYTLHLDSPASGVAGNWKTGASVRWCSKRQSALTPAERQELARRIEQDRQRIEQEQQARHAEAARRARLVWDRAGGASSAHAYLLKKRIGAGLARQADGVLLLPVVDFSGTLHGLQSIDGKGGKRFSSGMAKKGHFIPVGGLPDGSRPLWIAEGWATASTLAELRPEACHIAGLDAGNLQAVATEARKRWPKLQIVIAGDFDAIGRQRAEEAAEQSRAMLLPPPAHIPEGVTDWNDLYTTKREGVPHELG